MLVFDIITLFPDAFYGPFAESIIARAEKNELVKINTVDLRNYTTDKHRSVDDKPYGGGPGMLMMPDPVFKAVEDLKTEDSLVILMSPQGKVYKQNLAYELSNQKHLIIICGHYEGLDERIRKQLVDIEISMGDYILTNGNIPAMALVDSIVRLIPGVLGSNESAESESFADGLLEYPQYTRPEVYRGMKVPSILLSGNHQKIKEWRKNKAYDRTLERRPELLKLNNKEYI